MLTELGSFMATHYDYRWAHVDFWTQWDEWTKWEIEEGPNPVFSSMKGPFLDQQLIYF